MEPNNNPNTNQDTEKIQPPPKPQRRVKPTVEGINAPMSTKETLTVKSSNKNSGYEEPQDSRLILPSVAKRARRKPHPIRNFFIWIIILGGLGYGGYQAYLKYWPKENAQGTTAALEGASGFGDNYNPADNGLAADPPDNTPISSDGNPAASGTPSGILNPSGSTATATPPAVPAGPQLKINNTSTGYLNVRSEPATSGKVVAQAHPGEQYAYTDSKYDWYQIALPNGQTGWVSGTYITVIKQ
ncbi:MAG: SH3 domain-containing protein [Patescibacteria group bacterium]|nr:SH3 domain-containing protein [Patescibacteria group bacterium]